MRSLFLAGLLSLSLFGDAHIFVYHRFDDSRHLSTSTSSQTLRDQFEYFKTHGYKVIPLQRLAKALKYHGPINDKWIVLTIDDSYKSFYEKGLPLFKEYGYPFTLFVYVEATDKHYGDFMSWDQVRETSRYGEIGLHGYGHRHECHLAPYMLKEDTERGLRSFAIHLKAVPDYYAYPYGEYNPEVKATIASYGFELILNQNSGAVTETSDPHDLDRIAMTGKNRLKQKLKIEHLDVEWIAPKRWPEQGRLKEIHAKIAPKHHTAELFISGRGWEQVNVKNGVIDQKLDVKLAPPRSRVFLKVGHKQHGIILVKE